MSNIRNFKFPIENPFNFNSEISLIRRVLYILLGVIMILSVNFLFSIYTNSHERHFYSNSYDCAIITKINKTTFHNGCASVFIQEEIGLYELILYGGYGASYSDFEVGDRICKSRSTLNFIRISKNNKIDTFVVRDNFLLSFIFKGGVLIKPFSDINSKCNCINSSE